MSKLVSDITLLGLVLAGDAEDAKEIVRDFETTCDFCGGQIQVYSMLRRLLDTVVPSG